MKPFPLIPAIILSILVLLLFGCGTKEKTTRTGAPVSSATGERYPASQTRTQTPVPSQGPRVGAVASSRIATDACHCLFSPMGGTQSAAAGQWVFYEDAGSGDAWMNIEIGRAHV